MNEDNNVITMDCESVAVLLQKMRKESKWLSVFLESYRPPLDGERYLTDKEVAELLRVSRRTLQEYRNNRILPFILLAGKVLYPESGLREVLEANYRKPLKGCDKAAVCTKRKRTTPVVELSVSSFCCRHCQCPCVFSNTRWPCG